MPKNRITAALVEALQPGAAVWDPEVRGFGVRRQARDPVYVLKARISGRQRFFTIGRHQAGVMTPERARKEAKRLLGLIQDGQDPAGDRDAAQTMPTVSQLCDAYLEATPTLLMQRTGRPKKESTLVSDRGRVHHHIKPLLGKMLVDQVTSRHVESFMHQVAAGATAIAPKTPADKRSAPRGGKGVAARTLGLLGAIFSYAIKTDLRDTNPVRGVTKYADRKRDRRLSEADYEALLEGLDIAHGRGVSSIGLAAIRVLVLTGWRRSEVTALRWSDIDFGRRTVRLGDTKSGVSVRPLSVAAVEIIKRQPQTTSPFVFPARKDPPKTPPGPTVRERFVSYQGLQHVFERVRQLGKLADDITPHILRHSFASVAADIGYGDATIAAMIGHRRAGVTARYTHSADAVLLKAADDTAAAILAPYLLRDAAGSGPNVATVQDLARSA